MSFARSRTPRRVILAGLALVTTLLLVPPSALAAAPCPNEAVRAESRVNPTTGQPFSQGLPDCRAYEVVVSTQEKGLYDVETVGTKGLPVAPAGDAVGFGSISAFAGVENVVTGNTGQLAEYVSHRTPSGWTAEGVYPPTNLIDTPTAANTVLLASGFSPDLNPTHLVCGTSRGEYSPSVGTLCAVGRQGGVWSATPTYPHLGGTLPGQNQSLGTSADLSRTVFSGGTYGAADPEGTGLYEIAGAGRPSPQLRLINVDSNGNLLALGPPLYPQDATAAFGDSGFEHPGSAYHAYSEDGETVYFTAVPTVTQQPAGQQQTVYARVHHAETVPVSNPSPAECTTCNPTPRAATYQGASADGLKVFFTTTQQLVNGDQDETGDLYMYNFANPPTHHLVDLSAGGLGDATPGVGANVEGVVRTSSDGSHVYFVATGVLTTLPNSVGELPEAGADNLYGVDTNTGEAKFIATLSASDGELWGESDGPPVAHDAQTTQAGRYLVFSTFAHLVPADMNEAKAAYRFDFQTGELTWLSHPTPGFAMPNAGQSAIIAPIPSNEFGGHVGIDDWNRAITANGEDAVFWTTEQLQANDINRAGDVYLWHNGVVSLISDGTDPLGTATRITTSPESEPWDGISESGSDIFFFTHTQLVGQHTDVYQSLYDARIGGGFPAPKPEVSCAGEEWVCQGEGAKATEPSPAGGSATQEPGSDVTAPPVIEVAEPRRKPRPLTRKQRLAIALNACRKHKKKSIRLACKRQARKRFAPTQGATTNRGHHQ